MLEALRSDRVRPAPLGRAFPMPAIGETGPAFRSRREPADGGEAVILAALCLVIGGAILLVALQAICIVQNL
ncbi:hypothetical protein [Methylobacterium platani]|uniref:Uncharacterized protein n=2 Tax=Methylobacterium platani TaxID=427683 RepID=A0A179RX27_9HYPH|nr:hypothetical protein [Methylobacterium platani]KMO10082.1 hypothetical protein SQ03_31070 [Methylobacterium platani JCM 14648]OAS13880.1 hypothetical protein A5481_30935 [Methylobacterium platani]